MRRATVSCCVYNNTVIQKLSQSYQITAVYFVDSISDISSFSYKWVNKIKVFLRNTRNILYYIARRWEGGGGRDEIVYTLMSVSTETPLGSCRPNSTLVLLNIKYRPCAVMILLLLYVRRYLSWTPHQSLWKPLSLSIYAVTIDKQRCPVRTTVLGLRKPLMLDRWCL